MKNLEIKILTKHDAQDFRQIRLAALEKSPEMFGSTYLAESKLPLDFFENCLIHSTVFGVYDQSRIIGLATLSQEKVAKLAHKAHLSSVFILPEYRKNGAATLLLNEVVEYSKQKVEQILLTVAEGNQSAIHLYEKLGFKTYGHEKHALKHGDEYIDEILMKLFVI